MNSAKETFQEHYNSLSKPTKSQVDTEMELRGRMMAADPMLEYFKNKEREKQGSGGDKPTYKGYYPPNRYNIRPGYRWDGVNRSNGHEKKLLDEQAGRKASEEESYRWSTRDM